MSDIPQPSYVASDKFKENYDLINWKKSYKRAPKPVAFDNTPVKGIPCIREDKPHVSESGAIHAEQVKEFNKECVRGVYYDNAGRLVSTSSAARQREAKRRGLYFN